MHENYRKYQRYSISARATITRRDEESPERLAAQVITISQGGMGFYTDVLFEKATPVSVKLLIDGPEGMDVPDGKIASVHSQGDNYFTGIAFDREISYDRFVEFIG